VSSFGLCQNLIEFWSVTRLERNGLGRTPEEKLNLPNLKPSFLAARFPAIYPEWERLVSAYAVRA